MGFGFFLVFGLIGFWLWFTGEATAPLFDQYDQPNFGAFGTMFLYFFGWALFGGWVSTFFTIVKQKKAVAIEVFGKFSSIKQAGLNVKPPVPFGAVAHELNLKIRDLAEWLLSEIKKEQQENDDEDEDENKSSNSNTTTLDPSIVRNGRLVVNVMCKDDVYADIPIAPQVQVISGKEEQAIYELENQATTIAAIIMNKLADEARKHAHDDIYKNRNEIAETVMTSVNSEIDPYGYKVVRLLIDEIDPGVEMRDMYNRVRASKLSEQAAVGEANAKRKLIVGEAEAKKESLILSAKGYKESRETLVALLIDAQAKLKENDIPLKVLVNVMQGVDGFDAARDSKGVVVMQAGGNPQNGIDIGTVEAMISSRLPQQD